MKELSNTIGCNIISELLAYELIDYINYTPN